MENPSIQILVTRASHTFLNRCIAHCNKILYHTKGLTLKRGRFLYQSYSYPLHLVIFEVGGKLGYFDSSLMEIGVSKSLLFANAELLIEVLQHEIAHLIAFLEHGDQIQPHGPEFRSICHRFGWKDSMKATIEATEVERKAGKLQSKILKLFDLASSKNPFEAKSALAKARDLMIKHNFDSIAQDEEEYLIARTLEAKKSSEKLRAICLILTAFFVYPVINHARGKVYLELFGEKRQLEIGEYLAFTLNHKLEELWNEETHLSGMRAKNSFFRGIAQGFVDELNRSSNESALIRIEKNLQEKVRLAYPRLSKTKTTSFLDPQALKKGRSVGSQLRLPKGLKKDPGTAAIFALQNKIPS